MDAAGRPLLGSCVVAVEPRTYVGWTLTGGGNGVSMTYMDAFERERLPTEEASSYEVVYVLSDL